MDEFAKQGHTVYEDVSGETEQKHIDNCWKSERTILICFVQRAVLDSQSVKTRAHADLYEFDLYEVDLYELDFYVW